MTDAGGSTAPEVEEVSDHPGPHRQLNVVEAAALSVAIMAPTAAMALNGSLAASIAGTAVALSFLLALVTIGLVSYAFVEFARQYSTAGSVYSFNGRALGARPGFLSGWALLLTYVAFTLASSAEVGLFFQTLVTLLHGAVPWIVPTLVALAAVWLLGVRRITLSTRVTLVVEGLSILIILVLVALIAAHGGAAGFSIKPFTVGDAGFSNVALASVFAFLSFAGFEGAAVLGEETARPRVAIPRAIRSAVFLVGVFYIGVIYMQAIGFGLDSHGVQAFAGSSGPLSDLAQTYAGSMMAAAIAAGASISAFASALGTATGATRLLFALGRDELLPARLGQLDPGSGSPRFAMGTVVVIATIGDVVLFLVGISAADVFGYLGTVGVLSLLAVYLATQVAAIWLFHRNGRWRPAQFVIPVVAIVLLGYTLYANLYPVPAPPFDVFPYLVAGWILLGVVVSFLQPARIRRVAEDLARGGG